MSETRRPVILVVRDGWGRNPNPSHDKFNAVKLAQTPACNALLKQYPWTLIHTSGEDVGLPEGTMGNSEVGHQNLGAGRVVYQESVRISRAVKTGEFFNNKVLEEGILAAKKAGRYVHLLGIASDAGVHGLLLHLYGCLEFCKRLGHDKVALHLFTDGRDTAPFAGLDFVKDIEAKCKEIGVGKVATIAGRYYAMDRDNRWERVAKAYYAMTGLGIDYANHAWAKTSEAAIGSYYQKPFNDSQKGDEFIPATLIGGETPFDTRETRIADGDTVIFYNYRTDRPKEISKAFVLPDDQWAQQPPSPDSGKKGFDRIKKLSLNYITMTPYEEGLPVKVAFPRSGAMSDIAGAYLSQLGKTQFRTAETEKFPHVTKFFNDQRDGKFPGEVWALAQSPKVATYDLKPEMSAHDVCSYVLHRLAAPDCEDFILVNFANGDMVGHTGNLPAAIKAVEAVDKEVDRLVKATLARNGSLIVTADHGNAEQMWDPISNSPHTAHTTYDVECIIVDPRYQGRATGSMEQQAKTLRPGGRLADVFPTVLDLMGLAKPNAMEGISLL
jgi:2,3-bisphosphoglycerate-independent phosphoglycerate mutase